MSGNDHLRRVLALFEQAVELPESDRSAWLENACAGDAALLAEVRAMLAADAQEAELSLDVLAGQATPEPADAADALIGSRIGAWQVTGVLGRGGMGAVYAVQRSDGQFRQQAALKRIRIGLDDAVARDRFLRERQILAQLQHPGIARLLDGGTDAHNAPYFVMERVDGQRIDHWCDARKLDVHARVRLFLPVLDAVAYAHRNLVVHRDIKPANIQIDEGGKPRLLDFGIARLREGEVDGEDKQITRTLDRVLTPEFAAPEQLLGEAIGTATDIYQLGVLLFCLLSGRHPHGITGQTSLRQQLQLLERDAGRASSLATKLAPEIAARHGADPIHLARTLRGDLDLILAKALQREPEARYPSAAAFRADLAAWLDGHPVSAREPSVLYRTRRFVQRHRWAVAGGALTLCAVLAGSGVALWQAHRASLQAARADAVSNYLTAIFTSIDPDQGWGRNVSVRDLLDDGVHRLDRGALAAHADAEARLRGTLGRTYTALGAYALGIAQVQKALALATNDPIERATLQLQLAELQQVAGDYTAAGATLKTLEANLPAGNAVLRNHLHAQQAELALQLEDNDRALALAKSAYDDARTRLGAQATATQDFQSQYALILGATGKTGAAVQLLKVLLATQRGMSALPKPALATTLHNLAAMTNDDGHPADAIAYEREALALRQVALPTGHPLRARSLAYLAFLQEQAGHREAALAGFAKAVQAMQSARQPDVDLLANTHNNWAVACYTFSDLACASQQEAQAIALWEKTLPADHGTLLTARNNLAAILNELGQPQAAEEQLRNILQVRLAKPKRDLSDTLGLSTSYNMLTFNLGAQGRDADALPMAQQALAVLQQGNVRDQAAFSSAWNSIAYAEWALGRCKDSIAHARTSIALAAAAGAEDRARYARMTLARCLVKSKTTVQEGEALAQAIAQRAPPDSGNGQQARSILAEAALTRGDKTSAARLANEVMQAVQAKTPWSRTIARMQAIVAASR